MENVYVLFNLHSSLSKEPAYFPPSFPLSPLEHGGPLRPRALSLLESSNLDVRLKLPALPRALGAGFFPAAFPSLDLQPLASYFQSVAVSVTKLLVL